MASKTTNLNFPDQLSKVFGNLYKNHANSDVAFIVKNEKFPAHRLILAAHSPVLSVLLFSDHFKEANDSEIPIYNTSAKAFQLLLSYFYTAKVNLANEGLETVMELYELAHRYDVMHLQANLEGSMVSKLRIDSIFSFLECIFVRDNAALREKGLKFLDKNGKEVLGRKEFLQVNASLVKEILERPGLKVTAMEKFGGLQKWIGHNGDVRDVYKDELLPLIDLTKLSNDYILKTVAPSNLYDPGFLLNFMASRQNESPKEPKPGPKPDVTKGTQAANPNVVYDGKAKTLEMGMWTRNDANGSTTFVSTSPIFMNFMNVQLGTGKMYDFTIDVSVENVLWTKIYKQEAFKNFRDIDIYMIPQAVRYIRFSGVYSVVSFKHVYNEALMFIDNVFVPSWPINSPKLLCYRAGDKFSNIFGNSLDLSKAIGSSRTNSIWINLSQPMRLYYCRFKYWPLGGNFHADIKLRVLETPGQPKTIIVHPKSIIAKGVDYCQFSFEPRFVVAFSITPSLGCPKDSKLQISNFEAA